MRCERVGRLLPEFLEDALSASQLKDVEAHLAECAGCREELRLLERALLVLDSGASQREGIDLWAGLQEKLAREQRALGRRLSCVEVQEQLPAFLEGEVGARQREALQGHLLGCPACSAERRLLENSLRAIDHVAAATPDNLWPEFQRRLAAERQAGRRPLSCRRAAAAAPAYLEGVLAPRQRRAVEAHLHTCPMCERDCERLRASLARLNALPPAPLPRDLWPDMAARLAFEPQRVPALPLAPVWRNWQAARLGGLAAAAAVLVAGLFFGGWRLWRASEPDAGPNIVAANPAGPSLPPQPAVQPDRQRPNPIVAPPARRSTVPLDGSRNAGHEPPNSTASREAQPLVTTVAAPMPTRIDLSALEFSEPTPEPDPSMELNTDSAQEAVTPEVVAALRQIAKVSDSVQSPFEALDASE